MPGHDPLSGLGDKQKEFMKGLKKFFKEHKHEGSKEFQVAHGASQVNKLGRNRFEVLMEAAVAAPAGDPCCMWIWDEFVEDFVCVADCD